MTFPNKSFLGLPSQAPSLSFTYWSTLSISSAFSCLSVLTSFLNFFFSLAHPSRSYSYSFAYRCFSFRSRCSSLTIAAFSASRMSLSSFICVASYSSISRFFASSLLSLSFVFLIVEVWLSASLPSSLSSSSLRGWASSSS